MTTDTRQVILDLSDDAKHIIITSSIVDKDLINTIPGAHWDKVKERWTVRASWTASKMLRGIFGDRLAVTQSLRDFANGLANNLIVPQWDLRDRMTLLPGAVIPKAGRTKTLYEYQQVGATFLAAPVDGEFGACLFDPMGTGKTAQTLSSLRIRRGRGEQVFPVLVVAPNSVKATWVDEAAEWFPEARIADAGNGAAALKKSIESARKGNIDILVVNWESLARNSKLASFGQQHSSIGEKTPGPLNTVKWMTVIADEAHRAKNPQSKQTRALWALGHDARYRFALTGTPIANHPADLWAILHYVDEYEFPSKTKWIDRYCLIGYGTWGGIDIQGLNPDTREEFNETTEHYWRRVPKEAALPFLPPKVPVQRFCKLTAPQMKLYKAMVEQMVAEPDTGEAIVAFNALAKMTRLLQFAAATCKMNEDGEVIMTAPSCKVDELLAILEETGDSQVVVFAESRKLIELSAETLLKNHISYGLITGKQTPEQRALAVQRFQRGELRVMLCTIAAGGVGITLTAADTMVFMQRSFSAVNNAQAEDRCHRIGSEVHESITIIDLISENTVDMRVMEIASYKIDQLQDLFQDKARLAKMLLVQ